LFGKRELNSVCIQYDLVEVLGLILLTEYQTKSCEEKQNEKIAFHDDHFYKPTGIGTRVMAKKNRV